MKISHYILRLSLSLALLFSAAFGSYGSALMAGSQAMVICSGEGARTAMIGADGTEVPMQHDCSECCISASLDDAVRVKISRPTQVIVASYFAMQPVLSPALPELHELARGPPFFG